jgi:hypothetical protein
MNDEQETQPVDLESLFQDEVVNSEQVNQTIKDSSAPAGTYQSDPEVYPLSVFPEVQEEKDVNGNVIGQRKCVTIMGLFTGTFEGKEVCTRIRFRLSPDYRQAKIYVDDQWTGEFRDKPDSQSKLYAQSVKVYEAKMKEIPKTVLEVIEFLRENPFRVRTMQGRGGEPVVLAISPVRR